MCILPLNNHQNVLFFFLFFIFFYFKVMQRVISFALLLFLSFTYCSWCAGFFSSSLHPVLCCSLCLMWSCSPASFNDTRDEIVTVDFFNGGKPQSIGSTLTLPCSFRAAGKLSRLLRCTGPSMHSPVMHQSLKKTQSLKKKKTSLNLVIMCCHTVAVQPKTSHVSCYLIVAPSWAFLLVQTVIWDSARINILVLIKEFYLQDLSSCLTLRGEIKLKV